MSATEETLSDLHESLAKELLRKIKSGDATASELSVAVKFLTSTFKKLFATEETNNQDNLNLYGNIDLTNFINPEFNVILIENVISQ